MDGKISTSSNSLLLESISQDMFILITSFLNKESQSLHSHANTYVMPSKLALENQLAFYYVTQNMKQRIANPATYNFIRIP
jgi:hypothetical protein